MVDGHGGVSFGWWIGVQAPARCSVRCACSTTGRSTMRPSSWAAPGDAASAAQHAPRPVERLWRSAPARRGSARPGAGGCTAWRRSRGARDQARSASSRASSSSCGVTPATGAAQAGDARRDRDAAGGSRGQAVAAVGRCPRSRSSAKSSVPNTRRARRRRGARSAAWPRRARFRSARSTPQRRARRRAAAATCAADSALGSITAAQRRLAQQPQVVGEPRRGGVVDAHHDARPVGVGAPLQPVRRSASRAPALASGATASSRSSTTASAPLASAFAKRSGPVAGHEQVGARQRMAWHRASDGLGGAQRRDARRRR